MPYATLHLICGKIAAGKSSLAAKLGSAPATIVISEDHWTSHLFRDEMKTVADYVRCSARLRGAIGPHITALLRTGVSVVLDFPANTVERRAWMKSLIADTNAGHMLHFLDVPDDVCRARLHARNAAGEHAFAASDDDFDLITSRFVPPGDDEGLNVVRYPHS
jgi:predicted kinase